MARQVTVWNLSTALRRRMGEVMVRGLILSGLASFWLATAAGAAIVTAPGFAITEFSDGLQCEVASGPAGPVTAAIGDLFSVFNFGAMAVTSMGPTSNVVVFADHVLPSGATMFVVVGTAVDADIICVLESGVRSADPA